MSSIQAALNSLQSAASMAIMRKSMNQDALAMQMVADMMPAAQQQMPQLAAKMGSMDIRV